LEDPEAAITFVDGGYARAVMVGVAVGPLVKLVTARRQAYGKPCALSHRPPPLYIAQGDRSPPAINGLGAPDQGADQKLDWAVGPSSSWRSI
jgi:hypothetical protein